MSEIFTSCNYHTATFSGIIGINYVSASETVNKAESMKLSDKPEQTDVLYKRESVVITNV